MNSNLRVGLATAVGATALVVGGAAIVAPAPYADQAACAQGVARTTALGPGMSRAVGQSDGWPGLCLRAAGSPHYAGPHGPAFPCAQTLAPATLSGGLHRHWV